MKFRSFAAFFVTLFLFGCAGQRLPEGGPVDASAPEVLSVFPQPGTVSFTGSSIIIEFSEYVDRRTTEEAVFISPSIEEKEFEWSGTELEIVFNEELRKNTTYVVTIGTDVTDIRAGNRMAAAFTLSFSTGPMIDKGMIRGKVFDEKPDGVMIFSYRLNAVDPDTLNPAVTKPDYLSQAGKTGEFMLTNIAPGTYRLFAVRDDFRNLLYEPETDAAGTTADITLTATDTVKTGIAFTIAKEDTTPPRLSQVQASDNRHVNVQFSEALDSASVRLDAFSITDTLMSSPLPVTSFFVLDEAYKNITLMTDTQKKDERYVLTVRGIKDRTGFVVNPTANAKQFTASAVKDTIPPVLAWTSLNDRSNKLFPEEAIEFKFSDLLRWPIPDTAVTIRRLKDSVIVPYKRSLRTPVSFVVTPLVPWTVGQMYSVSLRLNTLADILGNAGNDTSAALTFTADDPENYGSIEGSFAGYSAASTVVQASNLSDLKQVPRKTRATAAGAFVFDRLPEGKYVLKVFDDRNNDLRHDAGTLFPYRPAEKFTHYQDTIRVRARWPVDGVIFAAP